MLTTNITIGPFALEPVDAPADLRLDGHGHDRPHLVVMLAGGFQEETTRGGATERCDPGAIRYSPAGDRHHIRFADRPSRCVVVELDESSDWPRLPTGRVYLPKREIAGSFARVRAALQSTDPAMRLVLEGELLELVARVDGSSSGAFRPVPRWLHRVRERLEAEESPSFSELARAEGYHPVYAARAFRRHFGCSAGELMRRRRLQRAVAMLRLPRGSLADIALACGFADQSHLSRSLQRTLAMTPSRLRSLPPR